MPRKRKDITVIHPEVEHISPGILKDPRLDPASRLEQLLVQEQVTHDMLLEAQEAVEDAGPGRTAQDIMRYKTALTAWTEARKETENAEKVARRYHLEAYRDPEAEAEYQALLKKYIKHYGDRPPYDILCERIAGFTVRLRQMEASGRDVDSGEYVEVLKAHASAVNQLQKYTESVKTEVIKPELQKAIIAVLKLVEHHVATKHPDTWKAIALEVETVVRELDAA